MINFAIYIIISNEFRCFIYDFAALKIGDHWSGEFAFFRFKVTRRGGRARFAVRSECPRFFLSIEFAEKASYYIFPFYWNARSNSGAEHLASKVDRDDRKVARNKTSKENIPRRGNKFSNQLKLLSFFPSLHSIPFFLNRFTES